MFQSEYRVGEGTARTSYGGKFVKHWYTITAESSKEISNFQAYVRRQFRF